MIKKSIQTALRITFLFAISSQTAEAQTEPIAQKEEKVVPAAPKLDYEYQFLVPDSSEGIEKSYKNGKLFAEIHFKNKGQFQFIKRYDATTGKLFQSDTVVNFTKMVGSSITYFPTGAIKEVQHRDTAGSVDHYTGYFENGQKKVSIGYRKGKRNGLFMEYHPTGKVKEMGKYLNDKREGQFKFYDARGTLLLTKKFKQDVALK
jgi:antitoxin component YwqK of YwqJK toxin-antitoxin module